MVLQHHPKLKGHEIEVQHKYVKPSKRHVLSKKDDVRAAHINCAKDKLHAVMMALNEIYGSRANTANMPYGRK